MAKNADNGMLWALGAVGALALGSVVAGRGTAMGLAGGSRSHAGCSLCGKPMGRGSFAKSEEEEGPRGSYLLRQRYDAKAGFVVPLATIDALNASYPAFQERAQAEARQALREGGVRGAAFARLDAEQRAILDQNGIAPIKGLLGKGIVQPSRTLEDYADEKAKGWAQRARRRARDAANRQGGVAAQVSPQDMERERSRYAADLYARRAWTIHVCEKTGYLARASRVAVYGKGSNLYDGVTFQLVLASKPKIDSTVRLSGNAEPMILPETKRSKKMVKAEEEQNEVVAETLDDAGDEADAKMLRDMKGMPYLRMKKDGQSVGLYFIADIGSMYFPRGMQLVPLLTTTSKMASPSFGIPAGRASQGGTCPGAAIEAQTAIAQLGGAERRICTVCYATSANYGYANNMTQQEARRLWVAQLLRESGSEACGYNLAAMIEGYARYTKHTDRKNQEIGVWNGEGIVVPSGRGVKYADPTPLQISRLGGRPIPKDTQIFFRDRKTPLGSVAGFFRIHDSGDFGVGSIDAYTDAWRVAASMLPNVFFWAPSRVWVARRKLGDLDATQLDWYERNQTAARMAADGRRTYETRDFVAVGSANQTGVLEAIPAGVSPGEDTLENRVSDEACRIVNVPAARQARALKRLSELPNFTLRPSGLYIKRAEGEPVVIPVVDGMVGSGVAAQIAPNVYPAMVDTRGVAAWQCPVYTKQEKLGGKEAKSCRTANCRACWLATDLPIFYGAH
jgi:hypothetical protein